MFTEVQIENYKSIQSLKIGLGRVNVFIGENGCGKSNVLEAIALAGAIAALILLKISSSSAIASSSRFSVAAIAPVFCRVGDAIA